MEGSSAMEHAGQQQKASGHTAQAEQAVLLPPPEPCDLDFLSPDFDAQKALNTPGLQPPDPTAQPLDYLAKCKVFLPAEMPESVAHNVRGVNEKVGSETTRLKHQALKERAAKAIQRIEETCNISLHKVMSHVEDSSPLACLKTWQREGRRVRVVTRHAAGVRGVAHGQLIAYDMFMNLLLRDVVEQYTVIVKVWRETPAGKSQGISTAQENGTGTVGVAGNLQQKGRWARKQDHRQRSLGQILIKGDNVVSVSCVQEGAGPAPAQVLQES